MVQVEVKAIVEVSVRASSGSVSGPGLDSGAGVGLRIGPSERRE